MAEVTALARPDTEPGAADETATAAAIPAASSAGPATDHRPSRQSLVVVAAVVALVAAFAAGYGVGSLGGSGTTTGQQGFGPGGGGMGMGGMPPGVQSGSGSGASGTAPALPDASGSPSTGSSATTTTDASAA